jgi:hypothetical protein
VGDQLETYEKGRMRVFLYDESFPSDRRQFEMLQGTQVRIEKSKGGLSLERNGTVRWMGGDGEIVTGAIQTKSKHTEFIVHHDAQGVTTVTALSDGVEVSDTVNGGKIGLQMGDVARAEAGVEPKIVQRLVEEDLQRERKPFEFIGGGRGQSQVLGNPLLTGGDIPAPYLAPLPPPRPRDDDRRWPEQPIFFDLFVEF